MRFLIALRLTSIFILTLGLGFGLSIALPEANPFAGTHSAWAREDDEEGSEDSESSEDSEYEDEDSEDESYSSSDDEAVIETVSEEKTAKPETVVQNVVTATPITETYIETDPGYGTDGDGDGLVDALDPDPVIPQTAYFTDDDGDSVPNALDIWPGTDDLLTLSDEEDTNSNGILDSYESL